MKELTKKQMKMLKEQAAAVQEQMDAGKDIREVLAKIYVENLEGKSQEQGLLMADEILTDVRQFDADYAQAQRDLDRYVEKVLVKLETGKTCVQRCNLWMKTAAAISAVSKEDGAEPMDQDAVKKEIEEMTVSQEEANEELEKELRAQVKEAILNSGVLFSAFSAQEEMLEEIDSADEAAGLLLEYGEKEVEYRAIVSMLAYTNIKNGEFKNMPADLTAAQTATLVCTQIEEARIAEAVGSGKMAMEVAAMLLGILGVVCIADLFISAAAIGAGLLVSVFPLIIAIPGCLAVIALTLHAFCDSAQVVMDTGEKVVNGIAVGVKAVVKGIRAVAKYVKNRIIPAIHDAQIRIFEKLRNLFTGARQKKTVIDVEATVAEG